MITLSKKIILLFPMLVFFVFLPFIALAESKSQDQVFTIYVFAREDCRHCQEEKKFLTSLEQNYPSLEVSYLNVFIEPYTSQWRDIARLEKMPLATPITLVGDTVFSGFDTAKTTGVKIEHALKDALKKQSLTPEEFIAQGGSGKKELSSGSTCSEETGICTMPSSSNKLTVSLPFLGVVDISSYPLPTLSLILGFVDGFNPCAMWVLVTFLLFLSQSSSRKQMIYFVSAFLLSQAIIYALILNVWLTTWNFVALDALVTPLVGLIAIGGGIFFLYEWLVKKGVCSVTGASKREKIVRQIKAIVASPFSFSTLMAVILLSFSVTVIEFACSIGIPQTFTKIIEMNQSGMFFQQSMVGLYILMYMIDDLFVFALAIKGIEKMHLTTQYSALSNLIGGILMLLLGGLLLFAPSVLQFG